MPFLQLKKFFVAVGSLLALVLGYFYYHFLMPKELEGRYYLMNFENSFSYPSRSDTLSLLADARYSSTLYGTGKYILKHGFGITYIYFDSDVPSDILGHTLIKKSLSGEIRILMSIDENIYCQKIDN